MLFDQFKDFQQMSFDYHIKVITTFTKLTIGKNLLTINLYMKKINIIFRYSFIQHEKELST